MLADERIGPRITVTIKGYLSLVVASVDHNKDTTPMYVQLYIHPPVTTPTAAAAMTTIWHAISHTPQKKCGLSSYRIPNHLQSRMISLVGHCNCTTNYC